MSTVKSFFVLLTVVLLAGIAAPVNGQNVVVLGESIRTIQPDGQGGVCYASPAGFLGEYTVYHRLVSGETVIVGRLAAEDGVTPQIACRGNAVYYLSWDSATSRNNAFVVKGEKPPEPLGMWAQPFRFPRTDKVRNVQIKEYLGLESAGEFLALARIEIDSLVWLRLTSAETWEVVAETGKVSFDEACATSTSAFGSLVIGDMIHVFSMKGGEVRPISSSALAPASLFGQEQSRLVCSNAAAAHVFRDSNGLLTVRDLLTGVAVMYPAVEGFVGNAILADGNVVLLIGSPASGGLYSLVDGQARLMAPYPMWDRRTNWAHQAQVTAGEGTLFLTRYAQFSPSLSTLPMWGRSR